MSEGPARAAVNVRTQPDKYGPGVEVFLGADTLDELQASVVGHFGETTWSGISDLVINQVAKDAECVDAGAVQTMQNAGFTPQPAQAGTAPPFGGGGGQPAPPFGGGQPNNGGKNFRMLGEHGGCKVYINTRKAGGLYFSTTYNGKKMYGDVPDGTTIESATLEVAVAAIQANPRNR